MELSSKLKLSSYNFAHYNTLDTVTFKSGVTTIPSYAFYYCESLMDVYIPLTVTSIGSNAFYGCELGAVYYEGTMAQWNRISRGTNCLRNVIVVCEDGDIDIN